MFIKRLLILLPLFFLAKSGIAQTACLALGQNPSTAFPVCGTAVFSQSTVPVCGGNLVPGPCSGDGVSDKNPFWYQFTCFASGTLGFVITPNNISDDYDWQLFDITNHTPSDVYTNDSLFVGCNWSGITGLTGASSAGMSAVSCATVPGRAVQPPFSSMPTLMQGHTYLLLISHFTDTDQSGYALSFGGGSAVITDSTQPHLQSASISCDNMHVIVKLNKKMQCTSLASDGSDFTIIPATASIIAESSSQCNNGFDMDSITLTLNQSPTAGNYSIVAKNGTDGNTIADNCNNTIPAGESTPLIVDPLQPTPMDSLTNVGCAPNVLQLVFDKGIQCSSIAPDGSDFIITGTSPVSVKSASGNCSGGLTNIIYVQLSAPIQLQGSYQIKLVAGDDNNTILNECGLATPAGSSLSFTTKDTVSALFSYQTKLGCKIDTIDYIYTEKDGVNDWQWNFGNNINSASQDTAIEYNNFGEEKATLIASNGVCSDTASQTILLDNGLQASFEGTNLVCPGDAATFKDNSTGNIISWYWDFGNGNASTLQSPPTQTYSAPVTTDNIQVKLTIQNDIGCRDSMTQYVEVANNCYIAVPSAFTPNNDGLNDYLYPLNAYKATDLTFRVYNRYGQMVFETSDWTIKWDGTFKGQPVNAGTYVWLLQYTDKETGKKYFTKGSTVLIR